MIYFICGASGSGKTACIEDLQKQLPKYKIYDFDDIGVPENADKVWRQESTEKWIKKLINEPQPTCLVGQMVLGEIISAPSAKELKTINCIFLDCNDIERINRLKKRNTYGVSQDTLNWSAWLRMHFRDLRWEPHVIQENCASIMNFDELNRQDHWLDRIMVNHIDTSFLSIQQVVARIKEIINSFTQRNEHSDIDIIFRDARQEDLNRIILMIHDDDLGKSRENLSENTQSKYIKAFNAIASDENDKIVIAEHQGTPIAVAQINFIQNLTYEGGIRAQIEGVRVSKLYRSKGVGKLLFDYLISLSKSRGCHMVQLTTDKSRPDAYQFYQKLGFVNSHDGFKLHL